MLCHCLFWCKDRQLKFFDEISNWLEEARYPPAMEGLENEASSVVKSDWTKYIDKELMEGMNTHYIDVNKNGKWSIQKETNTFITLFILHSLPLINTTLYHISY